MIQSSRVVTRLFIWSLIKKYFWTSSLQLQSQLIASASQITLLLCYTCHTLVKERGLTPTYSSYKLHKYIHVDSRLVSFYQILSTIKFGLTLDSVNSLFFTSKNTTSCYKPKNPAKHNITIIITNCVMVVPLKSMCYCANIIHYRWHQELKIVALQLS